MDQFKIVTMNSTKTKNYTPDVICVGYKCDGVYFDGSMPSMAACRAALSPPTDPEEVECIGYVVHNVIFGGHMPSMSACVNVLRK